MSLWKDIEDRIVWDFRLGDEFKSNMEGRFAFILDVYEEEIKVALYKIRKYSSESNPVKQQPPKEMLRRAVQNQCTDMIRGGMFNINDELLSWIRKNYFGYGE